MKKVISLLLSVLMITSVIPFFSLNKPVEASAASIDENGTITMGSYPQSRVEDDEILSQLNSLHLSWLSYGYYSGDGSYGSMKKSDYMQYADVYLNGLKYRAVKFSNYRPGMTISSSSAGNSYQDNNGYNINTVYWFSYEPIEWKILDSTSGLVVSNMIIDSQAYSNTVYSGYYNDSDKTNYACDYYTSSIREWLNNEFYATAFSVSDMCLIKTTHLNNNAISSRYDSEESDDKLFLLSWDESKNSSYGFTSDSTRVTTGTDYAKCQGLQDKYWTLRTAATDSQYHTGVHNGGYPTYTCSHDYVYGTYNGIRPAMCVTMDFNPNTAIMKSSDGNINFEIHDSEMTSSGTALGKIIKIDSTKLLDDINVSYNSVNVKADKLFTVQKSAIASSNIVFSKSGYYDFIIPQEVASGFVPDSQDDSGSQKEEVNMVKNLNDGLPYISSVYGRKTPVSSYDDTAYSELRTKSLEVSEFTYTDGGAEVNTYDVIITAGNIDSSAEYYIAQSGKKIKSDTGVFKSEDLYNKLDAHKETFAYIKSNGKTSHPVIIKIEKTTSSFDGLINNIKGGSLNLVGTSGNKLTLSDDFPILGGMEVSMDGTKFPIGFEYSGDTIKISLGVNIFTGKSESTKKGDDKWKPSTESDWLKWKNKVDEINNDTLTSAEKKWEKFKESKQWNDLFGGNDISKSKSKNFNWDMLGYLEIGYVNGNPFIKSFGGSVKLKAMVEAKAQWTIFNASVSFGATATVALDVAREIKDAELPFEWKITLGFEPELKLTGGVGMQKVLGAGAYGTGSAPINYKPINYQSNWSQRLTIGVKGELGLYADFIWMHNEWPLLSGEKTLLDKTFGATSKAKANSAFFNSTNEIPDPIVSVVSRDYLENQSAWISEQRKINSRKAVSSTPSKYTKTKLQSSIYKHTQSSVAVFGNKMFLVWIEDDPNRDAYNRYRIVYSIYDSDSNVWSSPKAIEDCSTNDNYPTVYYDGTDIYVAWSNLNLKADSDTEITSAVKSYEIKVAKYDITNDTFSEIRTITNDNNFDYIPRITAENGDITVYYLSSTDYSMTEDTAKSLNKYYFNSNETETVLSASVGLSEYAVSNGNVAYTSYNSNGESILYTNGTAVDFEIDSDKKMYCSSPSYVDINGESILAFYDNENCYFVIDGEVINQFSCTNSFASRVNFIDNNGVLTALWTEPSKAGENIYMSIYNDDGFSTPAIVNDSDLCSVNNLNAVSLNGKAVVLYNETQREPSSLVEANPEYTDGQTDFVMLSTGDFTDVSVSFGMLDESQLIAGENAQLEVFLENNGTKDISTATFIIDNGLGDEVTVTKAVNVKTGEIKSVILDYLVPENYAAGKLSISVDVSDNVNIDDSIAIYDVEACDIEIGEPVYEDYGSSYYVTVPIFNLNSTDAENVTITENFGYATDENGEINTLTSEFECGTISANSTYMLSFYVQKSIVEFNENNMYFIKLTAATDSIENYQANNERLVTIENYIIEEHVHNYGEPEIKEATCTEKGEKKYICQDCEEILIEEIETLPHPYDEGVVTKKATCAKTGTLIKTCTVCGTEKTETISKTSHIYETQLTEPTCLDQGYTTYICINCSYSYKANYTNAKGHNYVDGVCEWCGKTEAIIHLNENIDLNVEKSNSIELAKFTPEKSGTYYFYSDSAGDTYGYLYDSNMNLLFSDDDSGNERNFLIEYSFEAGKTYYLGAKFYSTKLGILNIGLRDSYTDGHNYELVQTVDPTCTTEGYDEYYCNYCRQTIQNNIVSALGHQYVSEITLPTCLNRGYTEYTCTTCGDTYRDSFIDAIGHSYIAGICENCGDDRNIYLDIEKTAVINSKNEYAYFEFTPTESRAYTFSSVGSSDTYGYLYDSDMNELASNDNGGSNSNFLIRYNCEAGKTYILGCRYYGSNTGSFNVLVEKGVNIVSYTPSKPLEFIENTNCTTWNDSDGNEYAYYNNLFNVGDQIVIENKNGDEVTYTWENSSWSSSDDYTYSYFLDENDNSVCVYLRHDQYNNHWVAGNEYIVTVECCGATTTVPVSIVENPVASISYTPVNSIEYIENTNGYWIENNDEEYYYYYLPSYKNGDILTVTDKDGNSVDYIFDSNEWEFVSEYGDVLDRDYLNRLNGQYPNHWTVGSDNYYTIEYMGVTAQVPVTIVENPVASISYTPANPIEFVENCGGNWNTNDNGEYYHYSIPWYSHGDVLTITDKDGNSVEYIFNDDFNAFVNENGDLIYGYSLQIVSDQYSNPWTIGDDNYYTVEYMGATTQVPVSIVENPIANISYTPANPIEIIENTNGYWEYDEETGEEFYYYETPWYNCGDVLTVTDKDGISIDYTYGYYEDYEDGCFLSENGDIIYTGNLNGYSNQYSNPWVIGSDNYYTVEYMGVTAQVPVTIVENPVESVEYIMEKPYEIIENTNGYWNYDNDDIRYYHYDYSPCVNGVSIIVHYKDGTEKTYYSNGDSFVDEDDNYIDSYRWSDYPQWQGFEHWTVGNSYQYKLEVYGYECFGSITIVENPIASISFTPANPIEYIENTNGYWEYNEETGEEFYYYETPWYDRGDILTVIDKDGNSIDYTYGYYEDYEDGCFLSENGDVIYTGNLNRYSNQYSTPWTMGSDNYYTVEYMGITTQVPVTIVENPVASISYTPANPIEIIENTNGCWNYDDNDESFYRYYVPDYETGDALTVTDNNGNSVDYIFDSYEWEFVSEDGDVLDRSYLNAYSDQYSSPWEIGGDNFYTVEYLGATAQVPVTIVESPVASISYTPANPIEIIENTKGYSDADGWYYYAPEFNDGDIIVVNFKDGTEDRFTYTEWYFVNSDGKKLLVDSSGFYSCGLGEATYKITLEDYGISTSVPVTIVESPVNSIEYNSLNGFSEIEGITYGYADGGTSHFRDGYVQNGDTLVLNYKNGIVEEYEAVIDDNGFYHFVTAEGNELDSNADFRTEYQYDEDYENVISVTVSCYGYELNFPIVSNVYISSITFEPVNPVTIIESNGHEDDRSTWIDEEGNVYYFTNVYWAQDENGDYLIKSEIFNIGDIINVNFSNGKTAKYTYKANRANEFGYCFMGDDNSVLHVGDIRSNQDEQPWIVGGDNYFTINFSQASTDKIPVTIVPASEHIHSYSTVVTEPTADTRGYTTYICDCGDSYIDDYTDYASDNSVLLAVFEQIESYSSSDFSDSTFENMRSVYETYSSMAMGSYSQTEIDNAVFDLLTAISALEPYLNLTVSAPNGAFTVTYNDETNSNIKHSLLFGTDIALTATANDGYEFVGWYDTINNLYFSKNAEYSFKLTTNTRLKAVFVKEQSATLTFTTYSNWVQSTVTKTIDEWNNVSSIDDLLPVVPYRYGYSNGRWVYDNAEVLAKLQTGENVSLIPEYDEDDTSLPTPPSPDGDTPVLDLYYKLDADANVGSFVMAAGIPENCQIESVGVLFYYKNAEEFDPTKFELLINNKMLAGRFNTDEIEDVYIVNMNKMSADKNWAARGYVTYYDADGNLKTVYSNQINIVNREQV